MMKKILMGALCAAAAFVFTACSSVQMGVDTNSLKLSTTEGYESVGHINVDIWGVYLFGLPLLTGSSNVNGKCRIFTDTVTVNDAIVLLTGNANSKTKCQAIVDVQTRRNTVWCWPTLVFFYKEVQASGNLLK